MSFQFLPLSVEYLNVLFSSVIFGIELYKLIDSKAASYFLFGLRRIGGRRLN